MTEQADQPPDHAAFQVGVFLQGLAGNLPTLPFTYDAWQERARESLDEAAYAYVAGGAGHERSMAANRRAFDRWQFVPRMMRDVGRRDARTTVLGQQMAAPIMVAPVGAMSILHPDGEAAVAAAASGLGLTTILSTVASTSIEEVAEASGDGHRWFQLYWPTDREVAASLVDRAGAAGYTAIVVTADAKFLPFKPRDLEVASLPFLDGTGLANYFTDEVFRSRLQESPEDNPQMAVLQWIGMFADRSVTWDDLGWLKEQTDLPILVKGILHPDDAAAAVDHGADGIVVSNHGGRQVDGAVGALDVLPECIAAVGDDVTVLFDSGVRSGADVAKAVAVGADAVLVGRPVCWGLAMDGQGGVEHVLKCLLAEYDLTLSLLGLNTTAELSADLLRPAD